MVEAIVGAGVSKGDVITMRVFGKGIKKGQGFLPGSSFFHVSFSEILFPKPLMKFSVHADGGK